MHAFPYMSMNESPGISFGNDDMNAVDLYHIRLLIDRVRVDSSSGLDRSYGVFLFRTYGSITILRICKCVVWV